jgi:hypothetical protein
MNDGTATITTDAVCKELNMGKDGSDGYCVLNSSGTLIISADQIMGNWSVNQTATITTFTQNGGTNTITGNLRMGEYNTAANYTLNNGYLSFARVYMPSAADSTATFTQNGGTNEATSFAYIGFKSTGTYNQVGGLFTNNASTTYLGSQINSHGTYNLSGGELVANTFLVGDAGTGVFNQSGGKSTINGAMTLGSQTGSSGTFTMNNGECVIDGNLSLGGASGAHGAFNMDGGILKLRDYYDDLIVPGSAGATGIVIHTGGNITMTNFTEDAGYYWQELLLGNSGKGTYRLGGSGTLAVSKEAIYSSGTFIQTGGTHEVSIEFKVTAGGCFRGWGTLGGSYLIKTDGRHIADGYGEEHTLFMTNRLAWRYNANGNEGTNGWYAVNHGRLVLQPFSASGLKYWGETSSYEDLVNHVKIDFGAVSDSGDLTGSLYATDCTNIPPFGKESKITAIWEFDDSDADPVAAAVDFIRFRYDHAKAAELGIAEGDLRVWTNAGGENDDWTKITTDFGIDTTANMITASNLTDIVGFYAVASEISAPGAKGTIIYIK